MSNNEMFFSVFVTISVLQESCEIMHPLLYDKLESYKTSQL